MAVSADVYRSEFQRDAVQVLARRFDLRLLGLQLREHLHRQRHCPYVAKLI